MNPKEGHLADLRTWLQKPLKLCGNCDHYHYVDVSCACSCVKKLYVKHSTCSCTDWVPHDNFEYVQWFHDKRQSKV